MVLIFGLGFVVLMTILLERARKLDRRSDVLILRALVSAGEQDHKRFAAANELHPIAGSIIDTHLRHPATHRPDVARIAKRYTSNSSIDARSRPAVAEAAKPIREDFGLTDFRHRL